MRSQIILLAVGFLTLHVFAGRVEACSCIAFGPPCQAYWTTPVVFSARVTEISEIPHPDPRFSGAVHRLIRFDVTEAFRGLSATTTAAEAYTGMGGGDCGYPFEIGGEYLIYAYQNPQAKKLSVGICSRTRPLADAGEDLDYIRGLDRAAEHGGMIYGTVEVTKHRQVKQGDEYPQPMPLSGVKVIYEGAEKKGEVMTDDKGEYRLAGLPAGSYKLKLEPPEGLWGNTGEQKVELHDRGCVIYSFYLEPSTSLSGRIKDEDNRPAPKIMVDLVPVAEVGERHQPNNKFTQADDQGRFTFRSLPPGKYYLGVRLNRISEPEFDYPRTFYPGTKDPAGATVVTITEGETLKGYDFQLTARLAKRRIEGAIVWPDGRPVQNAGLCFEEVEYAEGALCFGGDAKVDSNSGHFSFTAQEGIRYLVRAVVHVGGEGSGQRHAEPVEVPGTGDVSGLKIVISEPNGTCSDQRQLEFTGRIASRKKLTFHHRRHVG